MKEGTKDGRKMMLMPPVHPAVVFERSSLGIVLCLMSVNACMASRCTGGHAEAGWAPHATFTSEGVVVVAVSCSLCVFLLGLV